MSIAILKGVIHGKIIELEQEPELPDGQRVSVQVEPDDPSKYQESGRTNGRAVPNAAVLQALEEIKEIRKGINPKRDAKDYLDEARSGAMYGDGDSN